MTSGDNAKRNYVVEKSRLRPKHVRRMAVSFASYRLFVRFLSQMQNVCRSIISDNQRRPMGKRVRSGLLTGFTTCARLNCVLNSPYFPAIRRCDKETLENSDLSPSSSRVRTQIIVSSAFPTRHNVEQLRRGWLVNAQSVIYIIDNAFTIDQERYICINRSYRSDDR